MKYFFYALVLTTAIPSIVFAAPAFSGLYLSHSPEVIQSGKSVIVTATVVDRSESSLEFIWSIDGEVVSTAIGQTRLEILAPKVGEVLEVSVEVRDGPRVYAIERLTLRPATLYLESDAMSTVPPFYIGKRLPGPQGNVAFAAIPNFVTSNGVRLPANSLLYEWRVNGAQKIKPTLAKSNASFSIPFFNKPFTVSVVAQTPDGTLRAQETTVVIPTDPDIVIYETSPIGGIVDQRAVLSEHMLKGSEVTLIAYPLFTKSLFESVFTWYLNGSTIELPPGDSRSVTFRKTAEGTGSYNIETTLSNPSNFLERATQDFLLQF